MGWPEAAAQQPAPDPPAAEAAAAAQPSLRPPLPIDEGQKASRTRVMQILRNGSFANDTERQLFDDYYKRYFLVLWSDPANITSLPSFRYQLAIHFRNGKSGEPYERLNLIVQQVMEFYARENFHPAIRVNAMLMIGELNDQEAPSPAAPPTPRAEALPALLKPFTDPGEFKNAQHLDAVKVAAMVGIDRHARLGAVSSANPLQAAVVAAMRDVAGTKAPPVGQTAEGHAWKRGRAAEILGILGVVDGRGQVPSALGDMAADAELPLSARCQAAKALGQLRYAGVGGLDAKKLTAALARLVVDARKAARAADAQDLKRPLKHQLYCAWFGLTGGTPERYQGVGSLAGDAAQRQSVAQIIQPLQKMLELFGNRGLTAGDLLAEIDQLMPAIEAAQGTQASPPPAAVGGTPAASPPAAATPPATAAGP